MVDCDVIKDLIPLVNDDVASEESKKIVKDHCEGCSNCRGLLVSESGPQPTDDRIIRALKKSVLSTQIALLAIGVLIGIWFTGSNNTLYNFYIMPFAGVLTYFALLKKSLYVPLFIFILTELIQLLRAIPYLGAGIVQNLQILGTIFHSTLLYAVIYALLSATGIAVAYLLIYAFRREKNV
ncbi:MAG: zf-HC2 domain-containing protein [Dethiobacteria bacterium]